MSVLPGLHHYNVKRTRIGILLSATFWHYRYSYMGTVIDTQYPYLHLFPNVFKSWSGFKQSPASLSRDSALGVNKRTSIPHVFLEISNFAPDRNITWKKKANTIIKSNERNHPIQQSEHSKACRMGSFVVVVVVFDFCFRRSRFWGVFVMEKNIWYVSNCPGNRRIFWKSTRGKGVKNLHVYWVKNKTMNSDKGPR